MQEQYRFHGVQVARRADGVPEVGDMLEHREVEIDVVVRGEEGEVRGAHAGRVEVCLERQGGGGRDGAGGRDQRGCGRSRGRGGRRGQ